MPESQLSPARLLAALGVVLLVHAGCGPGEPAREGLGVIVSVPPLASVVEVIGGDHVWVESLTPGGMDPHSYEPKPSQLRLVGQARLFVSTGLLEVEQVYTDALLDGNDALVVLNVTDGMSLIETGDGAGGNDDAHDHDHGHNHGHHHHGAYDPHIWLSPSRMKDVAARISRALSSADPAHAADYEVNLTAFEADVDRLDAELREQLEPVRGRPFVTYHASFSYFAEEYGLEQMVIERDGNEPTPTQLAELIDQARAAKAAIVLVDEAHSAEGARSVAAAIGATTHSTSTLTPDWMANLRLIATALTGARD